MAYMNQEKKKVIVEKAKPILKKYGLKGSFSVRHHSKIVLTIKSGKLDFISDYKKMTNDSIGVDYVQGCQYWTENKFSGECLAAIEELQDAMKAADWYNNSDAQIDYFDTAYYYDVNVGSWNKPYELIK